MMPRRLLPWFFGWWPHACMAPVLLALGITAVPPASRAQEALETTTVYLVCRSGPFYLPPQCRRVTIITAAIPLRTD